MVTTVGKDILEKSNDGFLKVAAVGRRKAHVKPLWATRETGVERKDQRMAISLGIEIDILGGQFVGS